MKVLCDVHIQLNLVNFLKKNSIDAQHVNLILRGYSTSDANIAAYADEHNFIVITKDIDFRNSFFIKKSPKKLLRICLGNISTSELSLLFQKHLELLKRTYLTSGSFYMEISRDNILVINP